MRGSQRQLKPALVFAIAGLLAICPGCNPLGWGISHVDSLIHHHAHKPIVREGELEPGADCGVYRPDDAARPV